MSELSYEDNLKRRLKLLRKHLEEGKIHIAEHLADDMRESFAAVRYGPDGEIDLSTVDGRVRSMALAVDAMEQREDAKKEISLLEIQQMYFSFIENSFGNIYADMIDARANPQQVAEVLSGNSDIVESTYPQIVDFVDTLAEFWRACSDPLRYHLQDMNVIKGVFGGDLFPSYTQNIASSCGLYLDTIVLTDPFMNSREMFKRWDRVTAVRYFIKHAMNVLLYRDLALADVKIPIVVIMPFDSSIDKDERNLLGQWSEGDAVKHGERIFGRKFSSAEEFISFCLSIDPDSDFNKIIVDPKRLLFDTDWHGSINEQIDRAMREFGEISGSTTIGQLILNQCFGRMMQATDVLYKSRTLGGTPLIDAPTSWTYLNWKMEYDAPQNEADVALHMLHGLQRAGNTDAEWLGKIPPAALIEIRKEGAMQEIRDILAAGITEVADANPGNFFRTTDKIVDNIEAAFRKHRENIDELRRKNLKFWGYDIGSWIVTGSIGVAAALTANPFLAIGAMASDQILDPPKLKALPSRFKDIATQKKLLSRSPTGLFFKYHP